MPTATAARLPVPFMQNSLLAGEGIRANSGLGELTDPDSFAG
jgi:hypothetical protein